MQRHSDSFIWTFLLLSAVLLAATPVRADVTGSILGFVRDSSQAVVPNAHVTAANVGTGLSQSTATDAQGEYRFLALPPGR
ncbi:MAG: carboxypeptidase-like regulatory domain-containing protein, partial [Terriglobia bacterium]